MFSYYFSFHMMVLSLIVHVIDIYKPNSLFKENNLLIQLYEIKLIFESLRKLVSILRVKNLLTSLRLNWVDIFVDIFLLKTWLFHINMHLISNNSINIDSYICLVIKFYGERENYQTLWVWYNQILKGNNILYWCYWYFTLISCSRHLSRKTLFKIWLQRDNFLHIQSILLLFSIIVKICH